MSTYDDASLVMIPSGYKTGTVFSQKPMSTSGQLTFTRSNDTATRVGPDGLIEKVRTNLILQSQNFSNAAWSKSAGTTLTHSQTDPDGGTTATRVVMTSGTNNFFTQAISGSGTRFITLSVFVKGVTTGGTFSLNTGTAASRTGTTITYTTTWTRYQIIQNETTSNTGFQIDNFSNSLGQVAGDFLIAFAQVESSDFGATPYIATTTAAVSVGPVANVPRLDYLNSSCPKLILEPQRVNLVTFSEQLNNAAWGKTNASVTANQITSPDGFTNADLLQSLSSTEPRIRQTTTQTGGAAFTFSCFAKKGNVNFLILRNIAVNNVGGSRAWFNLDTGVVGTVNAGLTASMQNYGNGWYRCIISGTTDAVPTNLVDISLSATDNSISGSAIGSNINIYGCQLEAGAYATSYIPTLGAAVTRGADAASKTGISSLIGQTEGTLYWEGEIKLGESSRLLFVSDGALLNFINTLVGSSGEVSAAIRVAATTSTAFTSSALTAGVHKIAFAYKANDSALYVDGVSISGTSGAAVPATSRLDIGSRLGADSFFNSGTSQALLFKTRLTNAQLAEITTI